jgi:hypothetical protein
MPNLSSTAINFNATGDTTLVTGVAGQIISVFQLFLVVSATTALTFKDGTTALTGAMSMSANGSIFLHYDTTPWFFAGAGNNFVLNQFASAQISGRIYYVQR